MHKLRVVAHIALAGLLLISPIHLLAQDPEYALLHKLANGPSQFIFCAIESNDFTPSLLMIVQFDPKHSNYVIRYERITNLFKKSKEYVHHPKNFKPKEINCPNEIVSVLNNINADLSFLKEAPGLYYPLPDGHGSYYYFIKHRSSEIYINDMAGCYENLYKVQNAISSEIQRSEKSISSQPTP